MSDYLKTTILKVEGAIKPFVDQVVKKTGIQERRVYIGFALVGLSSAWLLLKLLGREKKQNLPPGPRPLPLLGNMKGFGHFAKGLERLTKEYGPIYSFSFGPKKAVVLSSADLIREAFIRNGMNFAGKLKFATGELFTNGEKDILMASVYDERVKIQRKLAFSALRNYASGATLDGHVNHAFAEVRKELENHPDGIDAMEVSYLISFNLLASMAVGKKFAIDDPFMQKIMGWQKRMEKDFFQAGIYNLLLVLNSNFKHLPFAVYKNIIELKNLWQGYLGEQFKEHTEKYDAEKLSDFTDYIIHEMNVAEEDPDERSKLKLLDKEHFTFILFDLFLAGTETSRRTLTWLWYYLAAFPEVQKKAQEEIDSVLGEDGRVTTSSREELHYVDCILHEVMRIKPVAPVSMRIAKEDISLGGFDIPKGYLVIANAYSVHFNEKEWENPYAFLPERWLDPQTGKYLFQESGFMPFSVGRRSCIGESFAKLSLHMLLTMVLQNYTIKPRPGYQIDFEGIDRFSFRPVAQTVVFEKRK